MPNFLPIRLQDILHCRQSNLRKQKSLIKSEAESGVVTLLFVLEVVLEERIHKFSLNEQNIVVDVYSGSIHVVDQVAYDILEDAEHMSVEEVCEAYSDSYPMDQITEAYNELKALQEAGHLYTQKIDSGEIRYNPQNVIKAMCLHVSHDCDLRCAYCFASQGDFKGQRSLMSLETGRKALDFLVAHSGNRRNLEVDLFGGEPLMNFEILKQIVFYGYELNEKYDKNIRFTITTNGMALDDEKIDFINEHMENVVMSLDGRKSVNDKMRKTRNGKGSYDTLIPKFQRLIEKRGDKQYYIRGTFTSENLDFTKDVIDFFEQGFRSVSIEPVVADKNLSYALREEHLEQILHEYEELSRYYMTVNSGEDPFTFYHFVMDMGNGPCLAKKSVGCGAGAEYVAVTPTGDIYPCHQFVGNEDFLIGTLDKGILHPEIREQFAAANVFNKPKCDECWAKFFCSGGCHANAFQNGGDVMVPYDLGCKMERKRIECTLSILANAL